MANPTLEQAFKVIRQEGERIEAERALYAGALEVIAQHPDATPAIRNLAQFILKAGASDGLEALLASMKDAKADG